MRLYIISISESYCHLGVISEEILSIKSNIKNACSKLKKTYFSIAGIFYLGSISPVILSKIYKPVVLSRALYGCEIGSSYSKENIRLLETAQNVCLKHMQQLSRNASSNYTRSCLNITSVETLIEYRKLQFFGQLCRLSGILFSEKIFNFRLTRYYNGFPERFGFIPDI
jgi:hypothetical protein